MVEAPQSHAESHALLSGKTVVVTAAAGTGIGFATAKRCVEEGARVLISDAHERRVAEAGESLGVPHVVCDVTDQQSVDRLFEVARAEFGSIDILVNNAGLGGTVNLVDMTDDQWSKVIDVTLTGTFRCTRAALQVMGDRGGETSPSGSHRSPLTTGRRSYRRGSRCHRGRRC